MLELLEMWALVEIIGILFLPLTTTVFRNIPDRGWAWSKALGIAVLAVCVWLPLMVIHALTFDRLFILAILVLLVILNAFSLPRTYRKILQILTSNAPYIIATECIFLGMVFVLGLVRSYTPNIQSFEMYMDEGFLASILRSDHFPPHDMWYAGSSINYYYYMHYVVAMLAKVLGQPAAIAFNTGISMLYGLTAVSLFGLSANIVSWGRRVRQQLRSVETPEPVYATRNALSLGIPFGLLTMLMALVLGNMAAAFNYFTRPRQSWYDWFAPSRVIKDTVNEFPSFSFLLSDFHAHTLTLAFTALAMGLALNFFLGREGDGIFAFGRGWQLVVTLFSAAIVLGGLFVMNGWDMPTYLGLAILCILLQQWLSHERQISLKLLLDICLAVIPLVVLAYLIFLPFYHNYISPTSGIGIVPPQDRSTLHDELLIYGLFAFVFLSLLATSTWMKPLFQKVQLFQPDNTSGTETEPEEVHPGDSTAEEMSEPSHEENYFSWPLIGMLSGTGFLVIGLILNFISPQNATVFVALGLTIISAVQTLRHLEDRPLAFTLLLGTVACALVTVCEIIFLRDAFVDQPRYNTVFKFYMQAWILLSAACGAGLYFIITHIGPLRAVSRLTNRLQWSAKGVWVLCLIALLALGSVYPIVAPYYRVMRYDPKTGVGDDYRSNSLDGMAYFKYDQNHIGDYEAIQWLNNSNNVANNSVIVEAFYNQDYSDFGRVSAFTGLQTIMGWIGHEYQWRMGWYAQSPANAAEFNRRQQDVDTIYTSTNKQQVLDIMQRYHAQYIYVGLLEHVHYPNSNLERFQSYMQVVYRNSEVTIYKIK